MSKQNELVQFSRGASGGGSKNLIINGKFEVDQRHAFASHTVTAGSDYFADRWGFYSDSGATAQYGATTQVVADAPTGFEKSFKWTTTSSGAVPHNSEVLFRQKIEGYNISHVDYGASTAKQLTLSFYVKSSIAGNYGFTAWFSDSGGTNRYNLRSYTINSANTWEYKTISIPANTANVMGKKTNLDGMNLNWDLGEGTTYSGSVTGNWQSAYVNGLTGGVKIADNNGATWQITGVQLEVNDTATDFEHEDIGTTLLKCYRYYYQLAGSDEKGSNGKHVGGGVMRFASGFYGFPVTFPAPMRAVPTLTYANITPYVADASNGYASVSIAAGNTDNFAINGSNSAISGAGAGDAVLLYLGNSASHYVRWDAEL